MQQLIEDLDLVEETITDRGAHGLRLSCSRIEYVPCNDWHLCIFVRFSVSGIEIYVRTLEAR